MRLPFTLFLLVASFAQIQGLAYSEKPAIARAELPTPGASGLGDTIHPNLGNGGYSVRHYGLTIQFAPDLARYTATSVLNARATQSLSRFNLDLKGTQVEEVTVDDRPAKWSRAGQELLVTPASPLLNGTGFTVKVRVREKVFDLAQLQETEGMASPCLIRYESWVHTSCQPSGAHQIAALADHPSQKAPATITIEAPSQFNAIANGELTGTWHDDKDGDYTTRRFESRQKLATELIQIGVGSFTVI
jgi:aminopeptidase N